MKIAIPTENGKVAMHFGRCPSYTIIQVKNNKVIKKEEIKSPGHSPGLLPKYLKNKDVDCIVVAGIGIKAQNLFKELSIQVIMGVEGEIDEVIDKLINDKLTKGESLCKK